MKNKLRASLLSAAFVLSAPSCGAAQAEREPISGLLRAWTPEDSVSFPYFAGVASNNVITTSADGRYFFVITYHGDLEHDDRVYQLRLWAANDVSRSLRAGAAPSPFWTIEFRSSTNAPGISAARFDADSGAITFLAVDGRAPQNLYRANIATRRVEQLSHRVPGSGADDYTINQVDDYTVRGDYFYFRTRAPYVEPTPMAYPMAALERHNPAQQTGYGDVHNFSNRDAANYSWLTSQALYVGRIGASETLVTQLHEFSSMLPDAVSPDGRYLVGVAADQRGQRHFVVLNSATNNVTQLAEAGARGISARWSPDGGWILLGSGTTTGSDGRPNLSAYSGVISAVSADGRHSQRTKTDSLSAQLLAHWVSVTAFINSGVRYELSGEHWVQANEEGASAPTVPVSSMPPLNGSITVELRQNANEPPHLVASLGRRTIDLIQPDPIFHHVWWATTQPFQWREGDQTITGGLMLPRNYRGGVPLPLVIQAYYYDPAYFSPDGPHQGCSDAAQALIARGFAVLQIPAVGRFGDHIIDTPNEGPTFARRIDAAIDALISAGIADPARIGLTGFSRGGYLVQFAITHPGRHPLAAAIVQDSYTGSYPEMLGMGSRNGNVNSAATFWQDRTQWLANDLTFNIDRVRTPVLLGYTDEMSGFSGLDEHVRDDPKFWGMPLAFAHAYSLNHKPFEMLFFPYGEHELQRPREQIELHRAVLEWMVFWLLGEMPADAERAQRWLELRTQQQAVLDHLAVTGEQIAPLPPIPATRPGTRHASH